jgi:hypothetical protein
MPCFHPRTVWKSLDGGIQFHNPYSDVNHSFQISCKQCTGCRQDNQHQWAIRCIHESSLWLNNIFVTLTYDNENVPNIKNDQGEIISNTLVKKDFQDFMKRLRKHKKATKHNPIRFFHCGEYGEKNTKRPHYHAILYNCNFSDREPVQGEKGLTTSKTLEKIWGKGIVSIGDVNFTTASYVAGYVQKKINGKQKDQHYQIVDKQTGEYLGQQQQEYATMSRRPGIAGHWFTKHYKDLYPSDNLHINGKKMRPTEYYDKLFKKKYPRIMEKIKKNRIEDMQQTAHLRTPEALKQAEKTHKARMSIYKRGKL